MIFKKRFRNKRLPRINAALEMRRNQSFIQGTAPDRRDIFFHTYKKVKFLVKRFSLPVEVKISNKKGVTLWPLTKNVLTVWIIRKRLETRFWDTSYAIHLKNQRHGTAGNFNIIPTEIWESLNDAWSSFQPFPSDFEGGLRFLHTGGIV